MINNLSKLVDVCGSMNLNLNSQAAYL